MAELPPRSAPSANPQYGVSPGQDELRGLRRWVIVAGVWAVAATVIALIALLDTSEQTAEREAKNVGSRVAATERRLAKRIDAIQARLGDLPGAEDVTKLEQRVTRAEGDATKATEDVKSADEQAADLEKRVKVLEDASDADSADKLNEP